MISKRIGTLLAVTLAVAAIISCKKDEETEIKPSLSGTLTFEVPEFVELEEKVTLVPKGITHPEGKGVGYYWKVTPDMESSDTTKFENEDGTGAFEYTFRDSLGTYTVTCYAYASGYYSSSATYYVTTVKGGINGSITDAEFFASDPSYTDPRDGRKYYTTVLGSNEWFRQNLAYPGTSSEKIGMPFRNAEAMNDVFGRFYTWEEAQKACPEEDGWRLPDDTDIRELAEYLTGNEQETGQTIEGVSGKIMVNAKFNTIRLWEFWPAVKITNESKLSTLPAGYANISGTTKDFSGVYDYAAFWTAETSLNPEQAIYRYIYCDKPDIMIGSGYKESFAANIRCVRDVQ